MRGAARRPGSGRGRGRGARRLSADADSHGLDGPGVGRAGLEGADAARERPALLRIVGPPGSGKTLLIVALAEELRRRGHRVGSAEERAGAGAARSGALVIALPSGGRVSAAPPPGADALRLLARRLDPQLALLLLEEASDEGGPGTRGPDERTTAPGVAANGTLALELVPPGGAPRTPPAELLAAVSPQRIAGAFAVVGPGDTLGLATLVERRLLGAAAGRSLDIAAEPPPAGTRRNAEGRRGALARALGGTLRAPIRAAIRGAIRGARRRLWRGGGER